MAAVAPQGAHERRGLRRGAALSLVHILGVGSREVRFCILFTPLHPTGAAGEVGCSMPSIAKAPWPLTSLLYQDTTHNRLPPPA
jgi:hypothetical protein